MSTEEKKSESKIPFMTFLAIVAALVCGLWIGNSIGSSQVRDVRLEGCNWVTLTADSMSVYSATGTPAYSLHNPQIKKCETYVEKGY